MKEKKPSNYISIKESRKIIKHNIKQMKYYESLKNRKLKLEDYTSPLRNKDNLIEEIGKSKMWLTNEGDVDYKKSYDLILKDIRSNKLGRITWQNVRE